MMSEPVEDGGVTHQTFGLPDNFRFKETLSVHQLGGRDPTATLGHDSMAAGLLTPDGRATVRIQKTSPSSCEVQTSGPGGHWMLLHMDEFMGLHDEPPKPPSFHPVVESLWKRGALPRLVKQPLVFPELVKAVLQQKVTTVEAKKNHRALVALCSERAPDSTDVMFPPTADAVVEVPLQKLVDLGVLRQQAVTLHEVARQAGKIEAWRQDGYRTLYRKLALIPGIGPWTVTCIAKNVCGDPDAVIVGDYHLPNVIVYALTGRARGTDAEMLDLLAPFKGQRGRIATALARSAGHAPRFGARAPLRHGIRSKKQR